MNLARLFFILLIALCVPITASFAEEAPASAEESAEVEDGFPGYTSMTELVGRVIVYIGILLAIGISILHFTRRGKLFSPRGKKTGQLKVLDTHMLGNKQFLVVVEHGAQRILLGVGPGMINKLSDLTPKFPEPELDLEPDRDPEQ